jgi:hypothetical protein
MNSRAFAILFRLSACLASRGARNEHPDLRANAAPRILFGRWLQDDFGPSILPFIEMLISIGGLI